MLYTNSMLRIPRIPKIVFIVVSIGISFLISSFLYSHYFDESSEFDTVALKSDVDALVTSVTTFHFELPRVTLFSQRIESPSPTPEKPYPTPVGSMLPGIPTSTPYVQPTRRVSILPTYPYQPTRISTKPPIKQPTIAPTQTPKPTKKPKPTPTPLAPPGYLRPGVGLEDIFKKAGELSCVPTALLKAFVAQEAPGVLNWSNEQALFYNAYDWWHRVKTVKQVCGGYGYYTHTGLVAEDSLFPGEKCKDPFSPETASDTYSRVIGSCQMLQSYWEKDFKNPTKQKLKVGQVDRRVLIDCLIGYGIHFRKDTGYSGSCNNWDMKYVAKAACVNAGGTCDNYCYIICNNYNKYAGKNNNCNSVKDLFVPGSYCQFK